MQPAERRLLIDDRPVAVGRRALDLLIVFAAHPDRLLTKDDLLARVWPGLVVEEGNLQMQVSNLRKLIGADMIETVPGLGYRFTASRDDAAAPAAAAAGSTSGGRHRLIGREGDIVRVETLLHDDDVTLVGTPGVGKTSVARVVAQRWSGRAVWVDLAALPGSATRSQIAGAIARALGVQIAAGDADAAAQLRAALRDRALLLVLDNAEHLIEHCAELVGALRSNDGPRLLVTSQVPLAVDGARIVRLEPLRLPREDGGDDDADEPQGALALLVDRIAAVDSRFVPTPSALPLLRTLCVQLDGLPLALEMAAARVPVLGVRGVHDALAQRFEMLTRGHRDASSRHRTLQAALDWSYRLLAPAERRLFRALGCFSGGFTLDLAVAVASDDAAARWDVVDALTVLADHSLVVVGSGDRPRYRLLETMRAFAVERLAEATDPPGDEATVRRRHAVALLALFTRAAGSDAGAAALGLAEMENARNAIAWARDHDLAVAAELSARVTAVTTFGIWRHESSTWLLALETAMDGPAGRALPAPVQALWWTERARIGAIGREAGAHVTARRAVALWEPLGRPRESLRATIVWVRSIGTAGPELDVACAALGVHAASIGDLAPRERLGVTGAMVRAAVIRGDDVALLAGREQEAALARELGLQDNEDAAESSIVGALAALGRHAEAAARGRELLARVDPDRDGSNGNLPWVLDALLGALVALGELDEVRALLPRAIAAARRFDTPATAPLLARLASAGQRHRAAARLVGHARQRYAERGMTFEPREEAELAGVMTAAVAALGPALADRLAQQGRSLTLEAAEALAAGAEP